MFSLNMIKEMDDINNSIKKLESRKKSLNHYKIEQFTPKAKMLLTQFSKDGNEKSRILLIKMLKSKIKRLETKQNGGKLKNEDDDILF